MITSYLPAAGTGYYRLDRHPLGGDYQRVPQDLEIVSIEHHLAATTPAGYKSLRGCNCATGIGPRLTCPWLCNGIACNS